MDVSAVVEVFHSFTERRSLARAIGDLYGVRVSELNLHRDMIGSVYFLRGNDGRYVFKLFHHGDAPQALQSLDIIRYLEGHEYPVVPVIPALSGEMHVTLDMPEGPRIGVLCEFLEWPEPNFDTVIETVGEQTGRLHNLMGAYPGPLAKHGKEFFIDRYIDVMKENDYRPDRTDELAEYGDRLWRTMERLPAGFCHGDLHSGNMVETRPGTYPLFDFDAASLAFPVIDAATLSDETNYNHVSEAGYEDTRRMFERLYRGYSRQRTLSEAEAAAIFDFIAIRHYELNATITIRRAPILGSHWLASTTSFDEQYEWLVEWADICERKRA